MTSSRTILFGIITLAGVLILFELTNLDLWVQDFFYDSDRSAWIVDRQAPVTRMILYHGPKIGIITLAVVMVVWLVIVNFEQKPTPPVHDRVLLVVLCLVVIPTTIAMLKNITNVHCPSDIKQYGGLYPYQHHFHCETVELQSSKCGRCFPAGHASGGFALMSLSFLANKRRRWWSMLCIGITLGWMMGLYQMLNGEHFLSHTLVTMLVAWIIMWILATWMKLVPMKRHASELLHICDAI